MNEDEPFMAKIEVEVKKLETNYWFFYMDKNKTIVPDDAVVVKNYVAQDTTCSISFDYNYNTRVDNPFIRKPFAMDITTGIPDDFNDY